MPDTQIFGFERDFAGSLRCIPMAVRYKLDRAGIKLSLRQWSQVSRDDRTALLEAPYDDIPGFRAKLIALIETKTDEPVKSLVPDLTDPPMPPTQLVEFAQAQTIAPPTNAAWSALTPLQRFTLIKLSRAHHDNINFVPALREFGLV
jgi:hypothetical protein